MNVNNGLSRTVLAFFENISIDTYFSKNLARELQLPCLGKRNFRVNTFGTDAITAISEFSTDMCLRSPQGHTISHTHMAPLPNVSSLR